MRIVVAMSGGVDSSVAALLLKDLGHELVGVFLRNGVEAGASHADASAPRGHHGCCSAIDACDAEEVAAALDIPFYALDSARDFRRIVQSFLADSAEGLTPNPCMLCNRDVKFGELARFARAMGAGAVATGHYARCSVGTDGRVRLERAVDRVKDQSYVLATVGREELRRSLFPLGNLHKQEVRDLARSRGLPVHGKPDSQEICFVPSGDHRDLLRQHRPELFRPGPVMTLSGEKLGEHQGAVQFTVGQRRGLELSQGPWFVIEADPVSNVVRVGDRDSVQSRHCELRGTTWLRDAVEPGPCDLQIRAHHQTVRAMLVAMSDGRADLDLEHGEVLTPGQYGVMYRDDEVVGVGRIARKRTESVGNRQPIFPSSSGNSAPRTAGARRPSGA